MTRSTTAELSAGPRPRRRTTAASAGAAGAAASAPTIDQVYEATGIDPWFLDQMRSSTRSQTQVRDATELDADLLARAKRHRLLRPQIGELRGMPEDVVRQLRHALGVRPVYKTVDTCAAEFAARTPYHYSSYDDETEVEPRDRPAVIILGSGPNRIGQGIEFDYSCVHAAHDAARGRLRDGDGQLQPRDGLDRLRHQRPAVLRAAHARRRPRDRARRASRSGRSPVSSCSSVGRPRSVWRSG